jgi:hypothetical protein
MAVWVSRRYCELASHKPGTGESWLGGEFTALFEAAPQTHANGSDLIRKTKKNFKIQRLLSIQETVYL